MTQYLLSVWHDDGYPSVPQDQVQAMFERVGAFNDELVGSGSWVFGGGLHHNSTATVVRGRPGADPLVSDGPDAESAEQMGGFWVIRCADLDTALKWARKGSEACGQPVEVRPLRRRRLTRGRAGGRCGVSALVRPPAGG